jgi:hypothetical protein
MFEKHKAKKAQMRYEAELSGWQAQRDELTGVLQMATSRQGVESSDLILKVGESAFGAVAKASLIEERHRPGTYTGGSAGISIPIGSVGGHSVRYRVGGTRGHYVQGDPYPAAVDEGELVITNQRAVFIGNNKTIECLFSKLLNATVGDGELALSVSNRQKVTRVHYGSNLDSWVHLHLTLAMSVARGDVNQFAAQIQEQLNELDSKRPVAPSLPQGVS